MRIAVDDPGRIRDLNLLQDFDGPSLVFLLRNAHQFENDTNLAPDLDGRVEGRGRILIHHRDLVDPNLAELFAPHVGEVPAGQADGSPADPSVTRQIVHDGHGHGGLPTPGLAHQAERLTALDDEVDIADRRFPVGSDFVFDIEVLDFEHRL